MARTHHQFVSEINNRNKLNPNFQIKIKPGSYYVSLDTEMTFDCCNGHPSFTTRPRYIIHKNSGCPLCANQKTSNTMSKGLSKFVHELSQVSNSIRIIPGQQYINSSTKMKFKCSYNHAFEALPKNILSGHSCPMCANISRRKTLSNVQYDDSVCSTIQAEVDKLTQGNKVKVVIIPIDKPYDKYHYLRILKESSQMMTTLLIFEDEWLSNRELIVSKIKHYTNQNNEVLTIPARKCVIKSITNKEKQPLLDNHHVQGNDNAQVNYGAYHNDELIAVMTFTAPRISVGAGKSRDNYKHVWELSRFCTDTNYRIPGIASKLLKHFQRNHEWKELYSFADKRWSVGNMYLRLGFDLVADNPPAYFYVVNKTRKHRWNYRKDVLKNTLANYDPNQTEYQNMVNHGYWRVWDCGTLKFSMSNN